MQDLTNHKLYITEETKEELGKKFSDNPEIFKIFQDVPPMDEDEIHEKAEKVRAEKAKAQTNNTNYPHAKTYPHLFTKPDMTPKDKEGMNASLELLETKTMLTPENIKLLEKINYTKEYIEIGGIKRTREDIKAKANNTTIYEHDKVTYFKRSEEMIKEQNKLLASKKQEIPTDAMYEKALKSLPGTFSRSSYYDCGNILALLTDMSMSGYCDSDGKLNDKGIYGYRWSASPRGNNNARNFTFHEDRGKLDRNSRSNAFPVRPVVK